MAKPIKVVEYKNITLTLQLDKWADEIAYEIEVSKKAIDSQRIAISTIPFFTDKISPIDSSLEMDLYYNNLNDEKIEAIMRAAYDYFVTAPSNEEVVYEELVYDIDD